MNDKSCCWTDTARGNKTSMKLQQEEEAFIRQAMQFLEHPSLLIRLANSVGRPVELAVRKLPVRHQRKIQSATEAALRRGLQEVTRTIPLRRAKGDTSQTIGRWHTAASFGVGAAGGFFGMLSLPVELPITTAIILRSIAQIAHESGMDLNDPQTQLECLYILSLGSPASKSDDALGSAYWTSRTAFAKLTRDAAAYLAQKTQRQLTMELQKNVAPIVTKLLSRIAARFNVVVSEKMLVEAVPVLGAIGGGVINATFTNYFSQAARYHFGLRALESKHGRSEVERFSQTLPRASRPVNSQRSPASNID